MSSKPSLSLRHAQLFLQATSIVGFGIMAGFFWTFTIDVNPALLSADGATYSAVQSSLNRNVRHGLFFAFFFGPPLVAALALLCAWNQRRQGWFAVLALAALLYLLGIVVFTRELVLPLNYYTESWNSMALPSDWQQVRERWNAFNLWRTLISALTFVLSLGSLAWRSDKSESY